MMKYKEWKVGLVLLWLAGLTAFLYLKPESPINNEEMTSVSIAEDTKPLVSLELDANSFEMLSFQRDAQEDVNNGIIRIYIPSGIISQENKNQKLMKERFDIDFWEEACVRPSDPKDLHAYNQIVFSHLDKKYGAEWRDLLLVETY